jgi:hypothetical protein
MEKHSIEESLPCVTVDRELLTHIEDYVRRFLNERFQVKPEIVDAAYETTICKRSQKSTFGLIANHDGILFPNEITRVELALDIPQRDMLESTQPGAEIEIEFNLTLAKTRAETSIYVNVKGAHPEEIALNFVSGICEVLKQKHCYNFLFHPNALWSGLLLPFFLILFTGGISMLISGIHGGVLVVILGIMFFGGGALLRRLKPYCSFDTPVQRRNDSIAKVVFGVIILGVILEIASSFIIKHLFD